MRIAVQCQDIVPTRSGGVEHFAYGVIGGMAEAGDDELVVVVPRGTVPAWRERLPDREGLSLVEAASTASLGGGARAGAPDRLRAAVRSSALADGLVAGARRLAERRGLARIAPDAVLYPYHRGNVGGRPAVVTVHDLRVLQPEHHDAVQARRLERNVARAAAIVTSWAHPHGQILEHWPSLARRLFRVPIPPLVEPRPGDEPVEPGLVLFASATAPHKNHVRLIEAVARARLERPVRLLCVGPTVEPGYDDALRAVSEHGLEDVVELRGFVSDDEVASAYRRAQAVVAPTLWEAASGAVLDAFAYGKPVACSDIPPLRSQVEELGGEANFFDPRNPDDIARALVEVLEDDRAGAKAGMGLRERTWTEVGDDYRRILEWVATGADPQRCPAVFP